MQQTARHAPYRRTAASMLFFSGASVRETLPHGSSSGPQEKQCHVGGRRVRICTAPMLMPHGQVGEERVGGWLRTYASRHPLHNRPESARCEWVSGDHCHPCYLSNIARTGLRHAAGQRLDGRVPRLVAVPPPEAHRRHSHTGVNTMQLLGPPQKVSPSPTVATTGMPERARSSSRTRWW